MSLVINIKEGEWVVNARSQCLDDLCGSRHRKLKNVSFQ